MTPTQTKARATRERDPTPLGIEYAFIRTQQGTSLAVRHDYLPRRIAAGYGSRVCRAGSRHEQGGFWRLQPAVFLHSAVGNRGYLRSVAGAATFSAGVFAPGERSSCGVARQANHGIAIRSELAGA